MQLQQKLNRDLSALNIELRMSTENPNQLIRYINQMDDEILSKNSFYVQYWETARDFFVFLINDGGIWQTYFLVNMEASFTGGGSHSWSH